MPACLQENLLSIRVFSADGHYFNSGVSVEQLLAISITQLVD